MKFGPEGAAHNEWYKETGLAKSTFRSTRQRLETKDRCVKQGKKYVAAEFVETGSG